LLYTFFKREQKKIDLKSCYFLITKKMTTRNHYKRIVIGKNGLNYVEGMAECGQKRIFKRRDTPKKWGMICFAPRVAQGVYDDGADNKTSYWNVGFVSKSNKTPLHMHRSMDGNFAWNHKPTPYWFCRTRNWMPYWGKATKQRAELVKEIRTYWVNKWYSETVPEIKKALVETTPLPKDVIDFVMPEYFEYPYEIKSF
jgi:hypothetical protein